MTRPAYLVVMLALVCAFTSVHAAEGEDRRPNIIWITIDDIGPDFGCYGNVLVKTPNLDRLALQGMRFENAFVTTPVCSPSRSALITGCYATTIGSHQHRSRHPLAEPYQPITELLKDSGYRCTRLPIERVKPGEFVGHPGSTSDRILSIDGKLKTDFNFNRGSDGEMFEPWDASMLDEPFFAMIDFAPQKGPAWWVEEVAAQLDALVDPDVIEIKPYWPDTPEMRDRIALYHEAISVLDAEIGEVLKWIEALGIAERTIIFVWGDHGQAAFRHKQWCYDSGVRVPLIMAGQGLDVRVRSDLVSSIDLAPTTLRLAGVSLPEWMEGRDTLDEALPARSHIFMSRDRCDETEDRVRAIRTDQFKLIRNFHPERAYIGRNQYTLSAFLEVSQLLSMRDEGTLTPTQALWSRGTKPEWEFYDLRDDPLELENLYDDPQYRSEIDQLKAPLEDWIEETDANNVFPEDESTIVPTKALEAVKTQRATPADQSDDR